MHKNINGTVVDKVIFVTVQKKKKKKKKEKKKEKKKNKVFEMRVGI